MKNYLSFASCVEWLGHGDKYCDKRFAAWDKEVVCEWGIELKALSRENITPCKWLRETGQDDLGFGLTGNGNEAMEVDMNQENKSMMLDN